MVNVDALLSEHASRVNALLDELAGDAPLGEGEDEIWALRFVLSHSHPSDDAAAASAARFCRRWRAENAAMLEAAREGRPLPPHAAIEALVATAYHGATKRGEPVYVIRAGIANAAVLMATVAEQDVVDWMMYKKEQGFLRCDALTRSTRTLTKLVTVNDLNHVSLLQGTDSKFQAALGKASKLSERLYPQLLGRAVLVNVPRFMAVLYPLFKVFMSKKTLTKIAICPGRTLTEDVSACPFAGRAIDAAALPTFLGGACRCKQGCVGGVPNDQCVVASPASGDGRTLHVVGPREKHEAFVEVDAGDKVAWTLEVVERGVEFSASLRARDGAGPPVTLVPATKYKAKDGPREGVFTAPAAGTVVATFDNSYSVFNSKTVKYRVAVLSEQR